MRKLVTILAFMSLNALAADDYDLFSLGQSSESFSSQIELSDYLKEYKPSTFIYFNKLDAINQNLVFQKHQENNKSNLTEIVLQVYKNRKQTQRVAAQD